MRPILSPASRSILQLLSREDTLCAFDFDGTLAPIVTNPDHATMRGTTRRLLGQLATRYPCVIVSGRSRQDVLNKMAGVRVAGVIGNHGAEMDHAAGIPPGRLRLWREALDREVGSLEGVHIEDKGFTLSVHYRQRSDKAVIRRRILDVAHAMEGVRVVGGKSVVNLIPEEAPHKGKALLAENQRLGCTWILYVGDDETDEDVFAMNDNLVSVRVGRKQKSHADFYLQSQAEIDQLLDLLCRMRAPRESALQTRG